MRSVIATVAVCAGSFVTLPLFAQSLEVIPVTDGIWAIVGEKEQRGPENLANNATFGLIVTLQGAVLVDPGGSWQGGEALHTAVRTVTDADIRYVINTGGQDHRWLGNSYWQAQGAEVIASADAVADQQSRGSMQMTALKQFLGDALEGTEPRTADIVFDDRYILELGGRSMEIVHIGAAHTPGDSFVWLAESETVFTGDIVYVDRILGLGDQSSITDWPVSFEAVAALQPSHVVPGHGNPTTLEHATRDTYDYLMNLRTEIAALIDEDGDIMQAPQVDQSAFAHLEQFESLAGRNAQTAFQQMEWE
ncbi:MAG: hypothetical protein BM558_03385 [Roseobacter sp. MedPE-SW]|nr:MAG: hypothetical protein BM558_03385 [Roseobacter sp. MedPE-SW]